MKSRQRSQQTRSLQNVKIRPVRDLSMASFLVSHYSGDQLVGTQTASIGDICDGQEFVVNAGLLYDGWYENELEYDSYTIEPISADALAQG